MKNKIFNNFALKILSVVLAFLSWLIVMNISDYSVTGNIDKIPVTQLNGDALEELDKIYDVVKGDTVDIVVKGRRSVVDSLTADDFIATADLSAMSITNTVQITVTPKDKELAEELNITIVDNTMQLSLEEKISVQLPITIKVTGSTADKYTVGPTTSTPNIITIEGPENTVSKIKEAVVTIDAGGANESFDAKGEVVLLDAYGEAVKKDKLLLSTDEVDTNIKIYPTKTVPVEVVTSGDVPDGYAVKEVLYQPQTVVIAGEKDVLADIATVVIDDISIEGLTESYESTLNIRNYVPDGVIIAQASDDVVVTVTIEQLFTKIISPEAVNIKLKDRNDQYEYEAIPSDNFSITVTGLKEDLDTIDEESLALTVSCKNMGAATYYDVELSMEEISGVTYEVTGYVNIKVKNK